MERICNIRRLNSTPCVMIILQAVTILTANVTLQNIEQDWCQVGRIERGYRDPPSPQPITRASGTRPSGQPAAVLRFACPARGEGARPCIPERFGVFLMNLSEKYTAAESHRSYPTVTPRPLRERRSEERRVGKECRSRWWRKHER